MSERLAFTTTLGPRGPAAAIVLTEEQAAALGEGRKRFPVKTTINGRTLRLSVARMGGEYLIGFSKAARGELGVEPGETVDIVIELDTDKRTVDVPPALAELLAGDPAAKAGFDGLSFTHRKEYARWIAEAKQEATRERRLASALERLREGKPPR